MSSGAKPPADRQPAVLKLELPAEPHLLPVIRHLDQAFASSLAVPEAKVTEILLAVHEACSNVVVHAYGEEGGALHLQASRDLHQLVVQVSDSGTPVANPESRPGAGLGLRIIRAVCDEVDIEGPGEYGTRLEMTFRLG